MATDIQDKLTIIVGAGASKEFGLPTGKELSQKIVELLSERSDHFSTSFTDYEFNRALEIALDTRAVPGKKQEIFNAAKLIRENLPIAPSIDNFLHTHRADQSTVWIGKLAIVFLLLRAEADSSLKVDPSNLYNKLDLKNVADTWLGQLFTQLAVAGDFSSFSARLKKIYFISFNYDRCIQQFFVFAARQYFNLDESQVKLMLSDLNIHYIYGSIGEYRIKSSVETSFGSPLNAHNCLSLVDKIQTFTEGRDAQDREALAVAIDGAKELYFLGFGFNKLNLDRIFPTNGFACRSVFATTLGQPELAISQIDAYLGRKLGQYTKTGSRDWFRMGSALITLKSIPSRDLIWECHRNFQTSPRHE